MCERKKIAFDLFYRRSRSHNDLNILLELPPLTWRTFPPGYLQLVWLLQEVKNIHNTINTTQKQLVTLFSLEIENHHVDWIAVHSFCYTTQEHNTCNKVITGRCQYRSTRVASFACPWRQTRFSNIVELRRAWRNSTKLGCRLWLCSDWDELELAWKRESEAAGWQAMDLY